MAAYERTEEAVRTDVGDQAAFLTGPEEVSLAAAAPAAAAAGPALRGTFDGEGLEGAGR